jgi:3-hydroxy-D-aspartate aldolase
VIGPVCRFNSRCSVAVSAVRLGERVEFVTPRCDPTVDWYDAYHVVRGDRLVAIVPIDAARASR